jgi:hypothetical protein
MRRFSALSIVMLALALASCGDSGSKSSTVDSSRGPTGASGTSSARGARGAGGGSRSDRDSAPAARSGAGSAFDPSSVKVSFLEKSFFGAKSQVVYFIARAQPGPLAQTKSCVRGYLTKAPSAYCFAFSSQRAFRVSGISRRPPANMKRPCWSAYWGKPKGRRPIGSASNPAAPALHCPGATG